MKAYKFKDGNRIVYTLEGSSVEELNEFEQTVEAIFNDAVILLNSNDEFKVERKPDMSAKPITKEQTIAKADLEKLKTGEKNDKLFAEVMTNKKNGLKSEDDSIDVDAVLKSYLSKRFAGVKINKVGNALTENHINVFMRDFGAALDEEFWKGINLISPDNFNKQDIMFKREVIKHAMTYFSLLK